MFFANSRLRVSGSDQFGFCHKEHKEHKAGSRMPTVKNSRTFQSIGSIQRDFVRFRFLRWAAAAAIKDVDLMAA